MSEKAVPQPEPTEEDVNTTPPNPQMADGKAGWSMPKPVFRKTSGYLPQGFEKRFSQDEPKAQDDNDSTAEMPAPEHSGEIEPQPDISEAPDPAYVADRPVESVASAAVPAKRSAAKVILIILGLLFAAALVVVLIAAVYLYYQMPKADGTF